MGCACSVDGSNVRSNIQSNTKIIPFVESKPHPLVTENANADQKAKALEAVKKNDAILMENILGEVRPVENLGMVGDNYTLLHAAAEFNSFLVMSMLTLWLKTNRQDDINTILTITDFNGDTPAMMCVRKNSSETFYILLKEGLIDSQQILQIKQTFNNLDQNANSCLILIETQANTSQPQQKDDNPQPQKKEDEPQPQQKDTDPQPQQQTNEPEKESVDDDKKAAYKATDGMIAKVEKFKEETEQEIKDIRGGANADLNFDPESKIGQIIQSLIKDGGVFVDEEFPANVNSLAKDPSHKYQSRFQNAPWKRPHELFESDYDQIQLFDTIDPNDISQGILGVCYFLAGLSAIAEFPSRLTKIFLNKTSNKYGIYSLKFYVRGVPTEIVVDDLIPCYADRKNTPLFSKPKGKELWVLLAEKAWGKLYKNYAACEKGAIGDALEYLLGCPSVNYTADNQSVDEIWSVISTGDNEKHIMGASTRSNVSKDAGLVADHAYSIISTHQLDNYRVLKLRNPWGQFEWKGDFSDNSSLWNDEYKRKVGFTSADDGVFFMTVEDFRTKFDRYEVCMYNDGWEYTYATVDGVSNHADYFSFTVDQPCEAYFRIHQDDRRNLPAEEQESFKYSTADMIVAYVEEDGTYTPVGKIFTHLACFLMISS